MKKDFKKILNSIFKHEKEIFNHICDIEKVFVFDRIIYLQ